MIFLFLISHLTFQAQSKFYDVFIINNFAMSLEISSCLFCWVVLIKYFGSCINESSSYALWGSGEETRLQSSTFKSSKTVLFTYKKLNQKLSGEIRVIDSSSAPQPQSKSLAVNKKQESILKGFRRMWELIK